MQRFTSVLSALVLLGAVSTAIAQNNAGATVTASAVLQPAAQAAADTPERQGILQLLGQLETAFNEGDAKAAAACWTANGEFVGPGGARVDGREAIERHFTAALGAEKGGKVKFHLLHTRLVSPDVAMVDALPEIKSAAPDAPSPAPRTAALVVVKQNGRWLIESARSTLHSVPGQANRLAELGWIVGDWASETSPTGFAFRSTCDWTAGKSFLIRKFKVEGKEALVQGGTEIIGWDPRAGRIRSWVFETDGGFGESIWVRDGDRWLIKYSGTLADGNEVSATHIIAKVDDQTSSMQSKDRMVNGQRQPDTPVVTIKLQPVAKAAEPAAPAKAQP